MKNVHNPQRFVDAGLCAGDRILIHGAAGGVRLLDRNIYIYRNTIYMHFRHEPFKRQPQPPRIPAPPANGHNILGQFIIRRPLESFGMQPER